MDDTNTKVSVLGTWKLFTALEKRKFAIFIAGIMLYKFGLEAFNGFIVALATICYDNDARRAETRILSSRSVS